MKTNLTSHRSTSPQCHPVRHLAALALLGPSLLALSSSTSQGAAATPDGATYTTATCTYVGGVKKWVYRVDPPAVQSFRLTVTYDPLRAQYNPTAGVLFKKPFNFVSFVSPMAGILIISGSTPVEQVKPGDVDIFEIVFDDLSAFAPSNKNSLLPIDTVTFTVGGAAGDFIRAYDAGVLLPPYTGAATGPVSRSVTPGILPFVWDPDGAYDNGDAVNGGTGGAGTWNTSGTSFDALPLPAVLNAGLAPADTTWINGTNLAVFGGNPGTGLVTVAAGISAGGLQFDMPGYQLSGELSGVTLTLATPVGCIPTIEVRAGEVAVNMPISGNQGLKKTGAGTVVLGGVNDFTGSIAIVSGNLEVGGSGQLGGGNYNSPIQIGAGATFRYFSDAGQTLSGVISGGGSLIQGGIGTLVLSGANTFTGGTTLLSGTLNNTGSLVGGATISGGFLNNTGSIAGGATIFSGFLNNTGSIAGGAAISGGTLNNAGSLMGGATISGGVLNNSSAGSLTGGVTVQSGIYSGGGNLSGAVVIGDGTGAGDAIFHPAGGAPTTLNLASLSLNSDAVFQLTLDSSAVQADKLFVSGGTTLGSGVAQLSVLDLASTVLPFGTFFTIIDNAPSATMSGFFNGLPDGASFVSGANTFQIDYDAGSNFNDVRLTAAPEPTSTLLLTAALALGGTRRLRSRRR